MKKEISKLIEYPGDKRRLLLSGINKWNKQEGLFLRGTDQELLNFLDAFPQIGENGEIRYVFTGGTTTKFLIDPQRESHDFDIIFFRWNDFNILKAPVGKVHCSTLPCDMNLSAAYLKNTATWLHANLVGESKRISSVHPGILLVQKLSNDIGRPPRDKDALDGKKLTQYWIENMWGNHDWSQVVVDTLCSQPSDTQRLALERLYGNLRELRLDIPENHPPTPDGIQMIIPQA